MLSRKNAGASLNKANHRKFLFMVLLVAFALTFLGCSEIHFEVYFPSKLSGLIFGYGSQIDMSGIQE